MNVATGNVAVSAFAPFPDGITRDAQLGVSSPAAGISAAVFELGHNANALFNIGVVDHSAVIALGADEVISLAAVAAAAFAAVVFTPATLDKEDIFRATGSTVSVSIHFVIDCIS